MFQITDKETLFNNTRMCYFRVHKTMCNFKNLLLWLSWSLWIGVMEKYQSPFQKTVLCIYLFKRLHICLWEGDACFGWFCVLKNFLPSLLNCFTFNKTPGAMRPKNAIVNITMRLKALYSVFLWSVWHSEAESMSYHRQVGIY